jgi:BASS family bile acid:Na+ symporter
MSVLGTPAAALAWLGRQGTRAIALSVFLGLAVPPLAALFKPFVAESIFVLLVLAFLRVDPRRLRGHISRPGLVVAATVWMMLVTPAVLGTAFLAFGIRDRAPDLFLALMLQASAAPIMSAPAFAALLGLDAALTLATLILCIVATPVTAPAFIYLFAGDTLGISATALALKLFMLLAGSAVVATLLRWLTSLAWIDRQRDRIDGLNVIVLFVFAVAVMDGVAARLFAEPLFVLGLTLLAFVLTLLLLAATALVFARAGRDRAFALGLAAGNRNMGVMLAATAGALPDTVWLYVALAQFPIYLLPQLLKPLAWRLLGKRRS